MRSDESIYADIQQGSHQAFCELYARYERPLFGFILKRVANRQDAEEIFQDVMLALLREADATFDRGGVAAWLYRVAANRTLNRLRSMRRGVAVKADVSMEAHHIPGADELLIAHEVSAQVVNATATLTPALREVYDLRQTGKSYEETAEILGIPVGSVKSRVHAMVAHLRKEVTKWTAK